LKDTLQEKSIPSRLLVAFFNNIYIPPWCFVLMVGDVDKLGVAVAVPRVAPVSAAKKSDVAAAVPSMVPKVVPRVFSSSGVKKRKWYLNWKWFVAFIVLAVLVWGVWAAFFSYSTCDNWDCFNRNLESCSKAKFVGGSGAMIFDYTIKGTSGDGCKVVAELLRGELNNQDSIKLESNKMTCYLPEGVVMIPESDIGKCTGLLKEGLQDLVIKKLHTYLVQNLGKLNLEMIDLSEGFQ